MFNVTFGQFNASLYKSIHFFPNFVAFAKYKVGIVCFYEVPVIGNSSKIQRFEVKIPEWKVANAKRVGLFYC